MANDDNLLALGQAARARAQARTDWTENPQNAPELLAPLTDAERRQIRAAVSPASPPPKTWTWGRIGAFGGLAMAAAAMLLVPNLRPFDATNPASPTALPIYDLEVTSLGYSETRSEAFGNPHVITPGMNLEVVLRPQAAFTGEVTARAYRMKSDSPELLPWTPESAPGGAFRWHGLLGQDIHLPMGPHQLMFVVGPPEDVTAWPPADASKVRELSLQLRVRPIGGP